MVLEEEGLEVVVRGVHRPGGPVLWRLHCVPVSSKEEFLLLGMGLLSDLSEVVEQGETSVGILRGINPNEVRYDVVGIGNLDMHHVSIEGGGGGLGYPIPMGEGVLDGQNYPGLGSLFVQCAGGKVSVSFKSFGHCSTPVVVRF